VKTRPLGVAILAAIAALGSVGAVVVALGLLVGLIDMGTLGGVISPAAGLPASTVGIGMLVYTIVALVFAYGLWTLQPWGWALGLAFFAASAASDTLAAALGWESVANVIVLLALAAAIIAYWLRPSVRAAFRRP
jgi:uncharacterized membrane protein (DUF2068 family)